MPKKIELSDMQISEMVAMASAGKSSRDIASAFHFGRTTVITILAREGVKLSASTSISIKATGRPSKRLGTTHTEESRRKMSTSLMGRPPGRTGPHTPETIAKISAATKGKNVLYTPEQRRELEAMRGRCKRFVRRTLLATDTRKSTPTELCLGYSKHQLLEHLGPKPAPDSEIDHIVPVVEFFRRGITSPAAVNALVNLQWLPMVENRVKSDKLPENVDLLVSQCLLAASHVGGLR